MFDDLAYYFDHYSHLLDSSAPFAATTFLTKIVGSHFKSWLDFELGMIAQKEFKLSQIDASRDSARDLEFQWAILEETLRTCTARMEVLENNMLALGIPLLEPDMTQHGGWEDSRLDFQWLRMRLQSLVTRAESSINSMRAVVAMAGNRQALTEARRAIKETKNTKSLALVGLIFIPLAYTSSLFSMNESYGPGSDSFWVYWAVALPLVVLVSLVTALYYRGLDEKAEWQYSGSLSNLYDRLKESRTAIHGQTRKRKNEERRTQIS